MEPVNVPAGGMWPPAIYIIDMSVWPVLDRILNDRHLHVNNIQVCLQGLKVVVNTTEDFLRLSLSLKRSNTRFRTYHITEVDEVSQVLIRYLPFEYELDIYHRDLVGQGIPVRELHRVLMTNRIPGNLVMALVENKPEGHAIYNIKNIAGFQVQVETPKYPICVRCGLLGHEEHFCAYPEFMLPVPSLYYVPPEPSSSLSISSSEFNAILDMAPSSSPVQALSPRAAVEISGLPSISTPNPAPSTQPAESPSRVTRIDYESFFNLFEFLRSIDLQELDTVADKFRRCDNSLPKFLEVYEQHRLFIDNINEFMKDMEHPYH